MKIIICEKMKKRLKEDLEKNEINIDKIFENVNNCIGCSCKKNFINLISEKTKNNFLINNLIKTYFRR